MSDSELSEASKTPTPPDHELERSLRREVVKAQRAGEEYSFNSVRKASESKLGLANGFYKNHEEWSQRSKDIIRDQMDIQEQSSPPKPGSTKPKESNDRPKKRASVEKEPAPRKKQRTTQQDDDASEELSSPLSEVDSEMVEEKPKKRQKQPKAPEKSRTSKPTKKTKAAKSDSEEDRDQVDADGAGTEEETKGATNTDDNSESELSVLLDEDPKPKKRRNPKESSGEKPKKSQPAKGKADATLDPDEAEIKRLQGWLGKCGIRKLWGKELKPYGTSKAKIKHLKGMLSEAGMTGRYSIEKASQIREARELAADIEAVQAGAERWGAEDERGRVEKQDGRPARRLVRGAKNYDFLSSDGEETD